MDQAELETLQDHARKMIAGQPLSAPNDEARRAELMEEAREQRLLAMLNDAVFWGTLKAHLALAVIGAIAWLGIVFLVLKR